MERSAGAATAPSASERRIMLGRGARRTQLPVVTEESKRTRPYDCYAGFERTKYA
jgi:hypothetical protein